jgi:hypothetical protein
MGDVPLTDRGIAVLRGHSVRVRNGFESFEDPTFHRSQAHREHPARTKRSTRKPGACRLASLSTCDCYPAICPRSASAPLIETIFSPGATPLTVRSTCCAQRPRATAFSARWDAHRCSSWTRIPHPTGVRPIASTRRAPREARGNLGVLPACRLASLSACDCYPALYLRSASAPFDREVFSQEPRRLRSARRAAPKGRRRQLFRRDARRCWSWTRKTP